MSIILTKPVRFNRIKVTEVRLRDLGPGVTILVNYAFMDGDGVTYGKGILNLAGNPQVTKAAAYFKAALEETVRDMVTIHEDELTAEDLAAQDELGSNVFLDASLDDENDFIGQ